MVCIEAGSLFHTLGAHTANARSPRPVLDFGTIRWPRSLDLEILGWLIGMMKYILIKYSVFEIKLSRLMLALQGYDLVLKLVLCEVGFYLGGCFGDGRSETQLTTILVQFP